jgi:hypothetical protein
MERVRISVVTSGDRSASTAATIVLEEILSRSGMSVCTARSDTHAINARETARSDIRTLVDLIDGIEIEAAP